jgi:hypothetical protein
MNQDSSTIRMDSSRLRYAGLALIPFSLIVAAVVGTVAATQVISKAFAEIQASAGVTSRYVSRKEAVPVPIPTPQMPGLVAPLSVQSILSTQGARTLEQVRLATLEPAKRPVLRSVKIASPKLNSAPAQLVGSPYAKVAVQ